MLDAWRDTNEKWAEQTFLDVYGSPILQAGVGIDPTGTEPLRKAAESPLHYQLLNQRIAELKSRIPVGGFRAAMIRGLLYAGMSREAVDERGFEMLRRIRETHTDITLSDFKALVREQFNILLIDQEAALAAIPEMIVRADADTRSKAFALIKQVLLARGELSAETSRRLAEVARLFGVKEDESTKPIPIARKAS
jgi:hypothetical protein